MQRNGTKERSSKTKRMILSTLFGSREEEEPQPGGRGTRVRNRCTSPNMRATKPWWKGWGWKCVWTVRQRVHRSNAFSPTSDYRWLVCWWRTSHRLTTKQWFRPNLSTDASSIYCWRTTRWLTTNDEEGSQKYMWEISITWQEYANRCVVPLRFCSKVSVIGNDFNISFCTHKSYDLQLSLISSVAHSMRRRAWFAFHVSSRRKD